MDEQKPQSDETTSSTSEPVIVDPAMDASNIDVAATTQAAEDNRDGDLKKAQADGSETQDVGLTSRANQGADWGAELKRFNAVVNHVLATKEALKLKACDIKIPPEFLGDWTLDSNRFFLLAVNLRRRQKSLEMPPKAPPQKAA